MTEIQWEDPTASGGTQRFAWFWKELQANPGKWARYPGTGAVQAVVYRRPGFEGTSRLIDGKRVGYARYVGNGDSAA